MTIYTDGSCQGNPGPGGFGVVVLDDNENLITYYSERNDNTTNNRMELSAILWAFLKYGVPAAEGNNPPVVYSDNSYCVNTLTSWMFNWERNGWIKGDRNRPENLDLIKPFFRYWKRGYRIDLRKVKGHAGNKWNEMADALATDKFEK